jgi:hypothetical protein
MSDRQAPIQAPTQAYDRLLSHRSPLSSSPSKSAPRQSSARQQRQQARSLASLSTEPLSTRASTPDIMISKSAVFVSPGESEKTRRARYAANQRHSKAREVCKDSYQNECNSEADACAAERKQRHREKNKIAAARCRSRQRKQVQTIQEKGSRRGQENTELKTMVQELRKELNGLRAMALDHQQCDCHVARYNHNQVERIAARYHSFCFGQNYGTMVTC